MTMNSDLIYDVLRKHEPDHVLLRATRQEAAGGLTDIARIGLVLARAKGRIRHMRLARVSPLAVPALIEEGREWVAGGAEDALLAEAGRAGRRGDRRRRGFCGLARRCHRGRPRPRRRGRQAAPPRPAAPQPLHPQRPEERHRRMMPAPLHVAGERLMLDPAGLLAWPARKTLVVGDLHLEKGSHFAQGGRMVPPYDTRETLAEAATGAAPLAAGAADRARRQFP